MRPDHSSDLVCLLYVKTRICNPPAVLSVTQVVPAASLYEEALALPVHTYLNEPSRGSEHARHAHL